MISIRTHPHFHVRHETFRSEKKFVDSIENVISKTVVFSVTGRGSEPKEVCTLESLLAVCDAWLPLFQPFLHQLWRWLLFCLFPTLLPHPIFRIDFFVCSFTLFLF